MQETVPITAAEAAAIARQVNCGQCWQRPGRPCNRFYPPGNHLARYLRAYRKGLLDRQQLAAVMATLNVIADHVIVLDVTR